MLSWIIGDLSDDSRLVSSYDFNTVHYHPEAFCSDFATKWCGCNNVGNRSCNANINSFVYTTEYSSTQTTTGNCTQPITNTMYEGSSTEVV